jgi:hypothetical protein
MSDRTTLGGVIEVAAEGRPMPESSCVSGYAKIRIESLEIRLQDAFKERDEARDSVLKLTKRIDELERELRSSKQVLDENRKLKTYLGIEPFDDASEAMASRVGFYLDGKSSATSCENPA